MKKTISFMFFIATMALANYSAQAQMYRASSTAALQNEGKDWIEKKLPASVITFSGYSGQIEIKTLLSSLLAQNIDSASTISVYADFTMQLDQQQVPEQVSAGKTFTSTGNLTINNVSKKITAQYLLEPRNFRADGFGISVVIRFNPADYSLKTAGETENDPLIVKVDAGYLNRLQNNF